MKRIFSVLLMFTLILTLFSSVMTTDVIDQIYDFFDSTEGNVTKADL